MLLSTNGLDTFSLVCRRAAHDPGKHERCTDAYSRYHWHPSAFSRAALGPYWRFVSTIHAYERGYVGLFVLDLFKGKVLVVFPGGSHHTLAFLYV
jgi:hypothetical protein